MWVQGRTDNGLEVERSGDVQGVAGLSSGGGGKLRCLGGSRVVEWFGYPAWALLGTGLPTDYGPLRQCLNSQSSPGPSTIIGTRLPSYLSGWSRLVKLVALMCRLIKHGHFTLMSIIVLLNFGPQLTRLIQVLWAPNGGSGPVIGEKCNGLDRSNTGRATATTAFRGLSNPPPSWLV